jgi:membrane protease YdiL (CAAX protease family)
MTLEPGAPERVASAASYRRLPAVQIEVFALVWCAVGLTLVYFRGMPANLPQTPALFFWFGANFVILFCVPALVVRFGYRRPLREFGLQWGEARLWGRYLGAFLLVMIPVVAVVSRTPDFQAFYPRCQEARTSALWAAGSAGGWLVYFFAWEWFFRGFLLFALVPRMGPTLAILVQMIPFAMMHFPKPEAEAWSSLIAGIALGIMAWRGRSFIGTWLLHWCVAQMMDLSVILWPMR